MNRIVRALVVTMAMVLTAATGLVGGVITIEPAGATLTYNAHAVDYDEAPARSGPPGAYSYQIQTALVDPATGLAAAPLAAVATPKLPSDVAVSWNPAAGRPLLAYAMPDGSGIPQIHVLVLGIDGRTA